MSAFNPTDKEQTKFTVAEFAAALIPPISRQRANEFCNRGDIYRGDDKKIDITHPKNAAWLKARATISHQPKPPNYKGSYQPPEIPAPPHLRNAQAEAGLDVEFDAEELLEQINSLDFFKLTKVNVDKIAKIETMLKTRVERMHKRGELIDRGLVCSVFSKLYTIDSNEWRTLAAAVAPSVAGKLGNDEPEMILEIEKIIDHAVMKTLGHVKRQIDEFLNKIGGAEG